MTAGGGLRLTLAKSMPSRTAPAAPVRPREGASDMRVALIRAAGADQRRRVPPGDVIALQRSAGNAAVARAIQRCGAGCGCGPCKDGREEDKADSATAVVQREARGNFLFHKGHFGVMSKPGYILLWAKEAGLKTAESGPGLRSLQEEPGSEKQVAEAAFDKLPKAIHDPDEFEGSRAARDDAVLTLKPWRGEVVQYVAGELAPWYERQLAQALGRAPANARLETRPAEVKRIRNNPHLGSAYTGRHNFMIERGRIFGDRTIVDVKGCPGGTPAGKCPKDPTSEIWFYRGAHVSWYYLVSGSEDDYDWVVEKTAHEVARSTQFAAAMLPLLIQIGGFSLGLSSRISMMIAGELVSALGEEGLADARGGKRRGALEILRDATLGVFIGVVTDRIFGGPPRLKVGVELEEAVEKSALKGRKAIAATDEAEVERALLGGNAKNVDDPGLRAEGFRVEVDIVSEGQPHTWRKQAGGPWCRWSKKRACPDLGDGVNRAAARNPPGTKGVPGTGGHAGTSAGPKIPSTGPRKTRFSRELADDPALRAELDALKGMKGASRKAAEEALDKKLAERFVFNEQYLERVRIEAARLRSAARTDPTAGHMLKELYEAQPFWVLHSLKAAEDTEVKILKAMKATPETLAAHRDSLLASSIRQKKPVDELRPPHSADVWVIDKQKRTVEKDHFTSGGVSDEDVVSYGFREANARTHTEAKAVTQMPPKHGQTMYIRGTYDPCQSCQRRMRAAASQYGGTIVYLWPGGPKNGMRFGGKWGEHLPTPKPKRKRKP